jgi:hypothetical protein
MEYSVQDKPSTNKPQSREDNIKLAQVAEQIGNYEDMYMFFQRIIAKSNFNFSAEERLLFATSFKHKVSVIQLKIEKLTNWERFYVWQGHEVGHLFLDRMPNYLKSKTDQDSRTRMTNWSRCPFCRK